jgi:succinate dehydrogenase/fumarate reductase flavoprotein subunit
MAIFFIEEAVMEHLSCDVLVLGSGAAGLRAAIAAGEKGSDVLVLSKGAPGKSTCTWFSGGVMAGTPHGASTGGHLERTLLAGRGTNQRELVEVLVDEAPLRLQELMRWGIRAKFQDGYLYSQGRPPVLGEELVRSLLKRNRALGTRFMGNLQVTDLVVQAGTVGVCAYREASRSWFAVAAKAAILATGGAAALYFRHDNPKRILGDGYRLALEAGATLQDMEFVQFYPVALAEPGLPPLVVPPRLADRGRLVTARGEEVLGKYGISERPAAERARDKLSQALFREIFRDRCEVLLHLERLSHEEWHADPFSAALYPLLGDRYGANHRPVRVAPVAHHVMGGVRIDRQGATTVPGLFAAGEVAGGLHGANRMGGNALSETLVFGARAGDTAADWAKRSGGADMRWISGLLMERASKWDGAQGPGIDFRPRLREIMWRDGGVIRNREGLLNAATALRAMAEESEASFPAQESSELSRIVELHSATRVGALILEGALRRCESRGAHFREDFPEQDDENWQGHLQVKLTSSGELVWDFRPE